MTLTPRRLVLLCGLVPTLALALLSLGAPGRPSPTSNTASTIGWRGPIDARPPSGRVAIVDVDERSLSTIGQWPWRRDTVAELLARIRDLGAPTIGVDVIFAESDPRRRRRRARRRAGEDACATAVSCSATPCASTATATPARPARRRRWACRSSRRDGRDDDPFFHATGAVCSLPELTEAAGAQGFLNAAPDSDGILRRVPLLVRFGDGTYPEPRRSRPWRR